jgi:hypothetical protein
LTKQQIPRKEFKSLKQESTSLANMLAGITHSRLIALAIDPLFPTNILAGTRGDAILKNYDGGQRWVSRQTDLPEVTISSLVHQLTFAPGTSRHVFSATSLSVFESNDGWQQSQSSQTIYFWSLCLETSAKEVFGECDKR